MRKIVATSRSLLGVGLMLVFLLVCSASALAATERAPTGVSFGPQGTGAGTFANVQGVTVDQGTGDVFVYDTGEGGRIYKFNAAGEPVDFPSLGTNVIAGAGGSSSDEEELAVDSSSGPAAGDIYASNGSEVRIYSSAGALLGTLSGGEMCGVAVDSSGAVYVGIYPETVRKYVPTSNPVTKGSEVSSIGGLHYVCNIAADSAGNLYVARYFYPREVTRYEAFQFGTPFATGTVIGELGGTLVVDQATGALYVNQERSIAEYEADGSLIGRSGEGKLGNSFTNQSFGIGVNSAKNELYVPSENRVIVFGHRESFPTVSGGEALEVTSTSAKVTGSVDPEGTSTTYQFEYGTSGAYGSVAPITPQNVGSDSTTHDVSAQLTGLLPSTLYYYRLAATGTNGTTYGPDGTFKTSGPPAIYPGSTSKETQSSVVIGGYVEPNGLDTHYLIEYGTSENYGSTTPSTDKGVTGGEVTEELTGLQLDTLYHYRFVATNSEGTAYGPDQTVSTTVAGLIESESVSGASNTEATLKATANGFGAQSTYYFEYGPTSAYGSVSSEEVLSSEARALLGGLVPETAYHFRVIVHNQYGTITGKDAIFTTAPSPSLILPDRRRYEKVSPNVNADGNFTTPTVGANNPSTSRLPFMAAADGNALAYVGDSSETGGTGHTGIGLGNQYLSKRSPSGAWTTENITPASGDVDLNPIYEAFTKDLTAGFMTYNGQQPLVSGAPSERYSVLYKRMSSTGMFEPVFTSKPPNRGHKEFGAPKILEGGGSNYQPAYAGSSADLSHVLFMANDTLTPNAVDGGPEEENLYDSHDGTLTLVNVLPNGNSEPNATFGGPTLASDPTFGDAPSFTHDVSEDGRRIFWADLNNGNLYLREDETRTIQVDAGAGGGGMFWTATPDGSKALFTKGGDIYEYDVESDQTTDLTPGAEIQGIVGTSENLSYVYFVADAALTSGAEHQECVPQEVFKPTTRCNLYVLHQGEPVRFIAELSSRDNYAFAQSWLAPDGDWQSGMRNREAEVTTDGSHLVFGSVRALTGNDENEESEEVFTYDYGSGRILCASCNPTGEPSEGFLPVSRVNTYTTRWMSSDGTKVFFDSASALVPQDTNGVNDVYEWEEDGFGGCERSQGCIYLLSAGSSPEGAFLLDASESGGDVFIVTRSQLTSEDQNETRDVYDVRANAPLPPIPSQCSGTGCQGIPSSPPVFATPSSVTYNGVGNFSPPSKPSTKAKKPKVKKEPKKHKKKATGENKKKSKGSRHKAKKSARKSVTSHGRSK